MPFNPINGTIGNDSLLGSVDADLISGLESADTLDGAGGDDSIVGGLGNDRLIGGPGNDTLDGGDGNDDLSLYNLNLGDQTGDDSLAGGPGDDILGDAQGSNTLDGGDGADVFQVYGTNVATGGAGTDFYQVSTSGANFTVTDFATGAGGDAVDLGVNLRSIAFAGWNGGNPFRADLGYLTLVASGGDTLLQFDQDGAAGASASWITLLKFQNVSPDAFTSDNFRIDVTSSFHFHNVVPGIAPDGSAPVGESITGTANFDFFEAGIGDDTVNGLDGPDLIWDSGGNDVIHGGAGNDSLDGGPGNDSVYGEDGDDFFYSAVGNDLLDGGAGDDTLFSPSGRDTLDGGEGNDTLYLQPGPGPGVSLSGGQGVDIFTVANPGVGLGGFSSDWSNLALDFSAGAGGDKIDVAEFARVSGNLGAYSGGNPFGDAAILRVVQPGADVLLQWDVDGPGASTYGWITVLTLQGVEKGALGGDNFVGVSPDGSEVPGELVMGSDAPESLEGGFFDDTVQGLGGNDTLYGRGGDDLVEAGDGDDLVIGDAGDDTLYGGAGNDWFYPDDTGNDSLVGEDGDDRFTDIVGNNTLDGGAGNDLFELTNFGACTVTGGAGQDMFAISSYYVDGDHLDIVEDFQAGAGGDILNLQSLLQNSALSGYQGGNPFATNLQFLRLTQLGADTLLQWDADGLQGAAHDWHTVLTLRNIDKNAITSDNFVGKLVVGTEADDDLEGDIGNDTIVGLGGDDTLDGVVGQDSMEGDEGDDFYYVNSAGDLVVEVFGEGIDKVRSTISYALKPEVENLALAGGHNLKGTGNELGNDIDGNSGDNLLKGNDGDDTLFGAAGDDTVDGGNGDDLIIGGSGAGDDRYEGKAGRDTMKYSSAVNPIQVDLALQRASGVDIGNDTVIGFENLQAGRGNDLIGGTTGANLLYGYTGDDTLNGLAGNDTLQGGAGNDSMAGGGGADTYLVEQAGDVVTENPGEGTDLVSSSINYSLGPNLENLLLTGGADLQGTGNGLANVLAGNTGKNLLSGGNGADKLNGRAGNDTLNGGPGADQYIFDSTPSAQNADMVEGFVPGMDKIMLDDVRFAGLAVLGNFSPEDTRFYSARGATGGGDLDDLVVYDSQSGNLYYDADGSGGGAAYLIATLLGAPAVSATDITVI